MLSVREAAAERRGDSALVKSPGCRRALGPALPHRKSAQALKLQTIKSRVALRWPPRCSKRDFLGTPALTLLSYPRTRILDSGCVTTIALLVTLTDLVRHLDWALYKKETS